MKSLRIFIILVIAATITAVQFSFAQEVLYPLHGNGALKANHAKNIGSTERASSIQSTINLPFIDDFSREGIYPSPDLWVDSGAFVNSTYCDNPPTIGVATLDGIDKFGNPYVNSQFATSQYCDTLMSQFINDSVAVGDTSVWFSFYYQPQGLGDIPENNDSLILQFKDTSGAWNWIWTVTGTANKPFTRINIHVTDAKYLFNGFQFCFIGYGTPNGNRDHWNIDYVYLNKNRVENDALVDVGFINLPTSLLAEYQAMPYPHYKSVSSPLSLMKTSMTDSVRNLGYSATTLNYFANIYDPSGGNLYTSPSNPQNSFPNTVTTFTSALNGFTYPSLAGDSASFLVKNYCTSTGPTYPYNDSSYYHQNFYNYYAYDDGSAESGAGLSGSYLKWAMEFNVKMADTLRGLQIYFDPTGIDVHNNLINLEYWSNVDVAGNSATEVFKRIDCKPQNIDSINGFATYFFGADLAVQPGNIWVGFSQNDNNLLIGLGVDRNTDSHTKMFASYDNTWIQSTTHGSWMIRPIFGKLVPLVGINEIAVGENSFDVYPVPANDKIYFTFNKQQSLAGLSYELCDIAGRVVMKNKLQSNEVDVSSLNGGIYFIRLIDDKQNYSQAKKVMIYH